MSRTEVPIDMIEATGPVAKDPHPAGNWRLPVAYKLADGQTVESSQRFSLKRDAVAFAATLPAAPRNPMTAAFSDGIFWGTSTSFYIGGAR